MQRRKNEIKGLLTELVGTMIYTAVIFAVCALVAR